MRQYIAETGSGKGNLFLQEALQIVREEERYLTLALPHEPDWKKFIAQLYYEHGEEIFDRLVIDRIADKDTVLMRDVILTSNLEDPWDRMDEAEAKGELSTETLAGNRGKLNFSENPVLEKQSFFLTDLKQELTQIGRWISDSQIHWALKPYSKVWWDCVDNVKADELLAELLDFENYSRRDDISLLEPVRRMFKLNFGSPAIMRRTSKPATFDKRAHKNKAGITLICGGGVSRKAFRTIVQSDFAEDVFLAHRGLDREGVYLIDELTNYQLGNDFYSRALATCRFTGLDIRGVNQSLNFPTPEITSNVLQNCIQIWGRISDPKLADIAAAAMRGAYDRYKVHHTTTKTRTKQEYEERRDRTIDDDLNETKRISVVPVNRYEEYQEDVYESHDAQQFWQAAEFQELPVGSFWVKEKGRRPYRIDAPLMDDDWVIDGLAEDKVEECIAKLKTQRADIYQKPVLLPTPAKLLTRKDRMAMEREKQSQGKNSKKPPRLANSPDGME